VERRGEGAMEGRKRGERERSERKEGDSIVKTKSLYS
jgi:hypothetical protein